MPFSFSGLVAGSGNLSAAEAPLTHDAPCFLLRPVSVSALFALWAVVGVPKSAGYRLLTTAHDCAPALFFVWLSGFGLRTGGK